MIYNFFINPYFTFSLKLKNEDYYLVVYNDWNGNFHHCINETVLLLELYMLFLNKYENIKILIKNNKKKNYPNFFKYYIDELPESKIFYTNNLKLIKGNFVYINPLNAENIKFTEIYSIQNRLLTLELINKANKKYNTYTKHNKIYISRRNLINKSWHNRYLTNIQEVSEFIIKQGYKEIFTNEIDDFLYQIYLINNCENIIAELGAGCDNIVFMNKNSHLTIFGINNEASENWIKRFYLYNNNVKITKKLYGEIDKKSKFYSDNIINKANYPYKYNLKYLQ